MTELEDFDELVFDLVLAQTDLTYARADRIPKDYFSDRLKKRDAVQAALLAAFGELLAQRDALAEAGRSMLGRHPIVPREETAMTDAEWLEDTAEQRQLRDALDALEEVEG